jgi:hypothetical protein
MALALYFDHGDIPMDSLEAGLGLPYVRFEIDSNCCKQSETVMRNLLNIMAISLGGVSYACGHYHGLSVRPGI